LKRIKVKNQAFLTKNKRVSKKPKIYDCFLFFNELELLEIRLNVLNSVVDYFVLVESTKTFTNHDKPLHYKENKEKFKDFNDKIIHIIIDDLPPYTGEKNAEGEIWEYDFYQRNQIVRGLTNADKEDIIILSDLDEIANPKVVSAFRQENEIACLQMFIFYYHLNQLRHEKWYMAKVFKKKHLENYSPQELRDLTGSMKVYPNAGWHFSYLGNKEKIEYKLKNTAHQQFNTDKIVGEIEYKMNNGIDLFDRAIKMTVIDVDENYPEYILNNKEKYKHLIKGK